MTREQRRARIRDEAHRRGLRPMERLIVRAGARYYVSVRDGSRSGFLLGPYASHMMALANVERGRKLAHEGNSWADFYAYGTASFPESRKTVFGR